MAIGQLVPPAADRETNPSVMPTPPPPSPLPLPCPIRRTPVPHVLSCGLVAVHKDDEPVELCIAEDYEFVPDEPLIEAPEAEAKAEESSPTTPSLGQTSSGPVWAPSPVPRAFGVPVEGALTGAEGRSVVHALLVIPCWDGVAGPPFPLNVVDTN